MARETLRLRVAELAQGSASTRTPQHGGPAARTNEKSVSALGGRLRGRIDLLQEDEVVDFKTGSLYEPADTEDARTLKPAYLRQLQIYAFLAHAETGRWVQRGVLYPLAGPAETVDLQPNACTTAAMAAVDLLQNYNAALAAASVPEQLASPSAEVCRPCPFKTLCPAFWQNVNPSWSETLGSAVIAGPTTAPAQHVQGGAARSLTANAQTGTEPAGEIRVAPLNTSIHQSLDTLPQGMQVRIVGLGRRSNGLLFPAQRTVILPTSSLPQIHLSNPGPQITAAPSVASTQPPR